MRNGDVVKSFCEAVIQRNGNLFAGFHLYNPTLRAPEPRELVDAVGRELKAREHTRYITGHCTGEAAYGWLKEILGDRLDYMAGGTVFEV